MNKSRQLRRQINKELKTLKETDLCVKTRTSTQTTSQL